MAAWLLWFLSSFEAGFWSALVAGKLRGRGRTRELLVYGGPARISILLNQLWAQESTRNPHRGPRAQSLQCSSASSVETALHFIPSIF